MIRNHLKLDYGMNNGRLLHIDEVERGLNCGCKCPACEHPLVAHKGPVKAAHFKHYQGSDCGKGVETALHHMAKGILENRQEIALPIPPDPTKLWPIEKVSLEKRLGDIIPDVIVYIKGQPILIEIVVTHGIDAEKMEKIKDLGISTLVIDLSDEERTLSKDELASIVVEGTEKKRWVFNAAKQRHMENPRRFKVIRDMDSNPYRPMDSNLWVDGCPMYYARRYGTGYSKRFAYVESDCAHCEFLVEWGVSNKLYELFDSNPVLSDEARQRFLNDPEREGHILCGWSKFAEHPNAIQ